MCLPQVEIYCTQSYFVACCMLENLAEEWNGGKLHDGSVVV